MKIIEDHITFINTAKSTQEIFERFTKVMHNYGYNQVFYGHAPDDPARVNEKRNYLSNYPLDWLSYYAKNNMAGIDPVNLYGLKTRMPAYWSRCAVNASQESTQFMLDAADAGLKSGIIVPLCDVGDEVSMVSVSRNAIAADETYETLAAINLLSSYFYQSYKLFLKEPAPVELSLREYEILNWGAEGKTDSEIAVITSISVATVRYHWGNIFKKLNANGRVYAVSKAMKMGLVTPAKIMAKAIA